MDAYSMVWTIESILWLFAIYISENLKFEFSVDSIFRQACVQLNLYLHNFNNKWLWLKTDWQTMRCVEVMCALMHEQGPKKRRKETSMKHTIIWLSNFYSVNMLLMHICLPQFMEWVIWFTRWLIYSWDYSFWLC